MSDNTTHIIAYQSDFSQVISSFNNLKNLNSALAAQLGNDFSKATDIISTKIDSISNKFNAKNNSFDQFAKISTVFKDAGGDLKTFTQQVQIVPDAFGKAQAGIIPL